MSLLFTVAEVAKRLKKDRHHVLALIKSNRLAASDVSLNPGSGRPTWRISEEAILAYLAECAYQPPQPKVRRRRPKNASEVKKYF